MFTQYFTINSYDYVNTRHILVYYSMYIIYLNIHKKIDLRLVKDLFLLIKVVVINKKFNMFNEFFNFKMFVLKCSLYKIILFIFLII